MARLALFLNHAFGLAALDALAKAGHLAGVVVPKGRSSDVAAEGRRRAEGAGVHAHVVDRDALSSAIPEIVAATGATAGLITAFPWRVPVAAIDAFPLGLYNAHPGLLPEFRGADPVFWQIRRGAPSSGLTVHRVEADLDTGPVFAATTVPLVPWETHGIHMARIESLVAPLALRLADALSSGVAPTLTPQTIGPVRAGRRPRADDLAVRWLEDDAASIQRLANACNGAYEGPVTSLQGAIWRLAVVTVLPPAGQAAPPGTVVRADAQEGVVVACRGGARLRLDVVVTREGTLTGGHLLALGLAAGVRFDALPVRAPEKIAR